MDPSRVKVDAFEGKLGEWDNWYHKFTTIADTCVWSDQQRLFKMTSALQGNAVTVHRNLPREVTSNYSQLCIAFKERYGKEDLATKSALRVDLTSIRQESDEDVQAFADRVLALTIDAYPAETPIKQLQLYAVEFFINGCRDKNEAWMACNIKNPSKLSEAIAQLKLTMATNKRMGVKYSSKQVTFENPPALRSVESTGGAGHMEQDCPNPRSGVCFVCGDHRCHGECNWRRRSPSPLPCYCVDVSRPSRDCPSHGSWRSANSPDNYRSRSRGGQQYNSPRKFSPEYRRQQYNDQRYSQSGYHSSGPSSPGYGKQHYDDRWSSAHYADSGSSSGNYQSSSPSCNYNNGDGYSQPEVRRTYSPGGNASQQETDRGRSSSPSALNGKWSSQSHGRKNGSGGKQ